MYVHLLDAPVEGAQIIRTSELVYDGRYVVHGFVEHSRGTGYEPELRAIVSPGPNFDALKERDQAYDDLDELHAKACCELAEAKKRIRELEGSAEAIEAARDLAEDNLTRRNKMINRLEAAARKQELLVAHLRQQLGQERWDQLTAELDLEHE